MRTIVVVLWLVGVFAFGSSHGLSQQHEDFKINSQDGAENDYFGSAVSLYGRVAVIGAWGDDDQGSESGSAYVFRFDQGSNVWQQEAKLAAFDGFETDYFGCTVASHDNLIAVSAIGDDDNGSYSGSVYVYRYDPNLGTWDFEAKLLASDGDDDDAFGTSLSVFRDVIAVGSIGDDDNGAWSGSAYIFRYDTDTGCWHQEDKLLPTDGAGYDHFGQRLAVYNDVIAITSLLDDDNGESSGSAYLFRYDASSATWLQESKIVPADGVEWDYFGYSVSLFDDVVLIGSARDDACGPLSGSAYTFRYEPSSEKWVEEDKLVPSDGAEGDSFGWSLCVSGDVAIVGCQSDDDNGVNSGSAYLFMYDRNSLSWIEKVKLLSSDGAIGDSFGCAVACSDSVLLVGAYGDDDVGSKSGSAYLFSTEPSFAIDIKALQDFVWVRNRLSRSLMASSL